MNFAQPIQQIVFQGYVDTVKAKGKRVDGLDRQLEVVAGESAFWPVIEALMALRGVSLLATTTVVAEIGDLHRFASAPQLMAYQPGYFTSLQTDGQKCDESGRCARVDDVSGRLRVGAEASSSTRPTAVCNARSRRNTLWSHTSAQPQHSP